MLRVRRCIAVWLSQDFSKLVIFDGLPNSGKFKKPSKLKRFVEKFLSQLAEVVNVEVQLEADGETAAGAAIVEFKTAEMALEAVNNPQANGTEFQGRVFQLNLLKDMDKYEEMSEEFEEPEIKPFVTSDDLYDWMSDKSCRDQFVIRYDRETEIFWSETKNAPVLSYGGDREKEGGKVWVHLGVEWSPQGTYLCTFHKRGVALWGGSDFRKLQRLRHGNVHAAKFSPDERYLATWNGEAVDGKVESVDTNGALLVWDVATGRALRDFPQVQASAVPDFSWSCDGNFLARLSRRGGQDLVQVYETPSMGLLGKASIHAQGVQELQWSPTDPYMVWWSPEHANIPACVTLTEFPSKTVVRTKNLFHVKTCRLYWQASGDFLCVEVTRVSKSGKTEYTDFQLFRMRERNIPIEVCACHARVHHPERNPHPSLAVRVAAARRSCRSPHKSTTSRGSPWAPASASSTRARAPAVSKPCSTTWVPRAASTSCCVRRSSRCGRACCVCASLTASCVVVWPHSQARGPPRERAVLVAAWRTRCHRRYHWCPGASWACAAATHTCTHACSKERGAFP